MLENLVGIQITKINNKNKNCKLNYLKALLI